MNLPRQFVCMFVFDDEMKITALVRKTKGPTPDNPNGQTGKLNGIGGGIKEGETIYEANRRETEEETGFSLELPNSPEVKHFTTETYRNSRGEKQAVVYYFYVKSTALLLHMERIKKIDDNSQVELYSPSDAVSYLHGEESWVWNVPYLLAMAIAFDKIPESQWPKNITHE